MPLLLTLITYTTEYCFFSGRNDFYSHLFSKQKATVILYPVDAILAAIRVTSHNLDSTQPLDHSHMGIETLRTVDDSGILLHRTRWAKLRLDNHPAAVLNIPCAIG